MKVWLEVSKRSGRQVTPAEFTRHIEAAHAEGDHAVINMRGFTLREDMPNTMEKLMKAGKPKKAVGRDGVHI